MTHVNAGWLLQSVCARTCKGRQLNCVGVPDGCVKRWLQITHARWQKFNSLVGTMASTRPAMRHQPIMFLVSPQELTVFAGRRGSPSSSDRAIYRGDEVVAQARPDPITESSAKPTLRG